MIAQCNLLCKYILYNNFIYFCLLQPYISKELYNNFYLLLSTIIHVIIIIFIIIMCFKLFLYIDCIYTTVYNSNFQKFILFSLPSLCACICCVCVCFIFQEERDMLLREIEEKNHNNNNIKEKVTSATKIERYIAYLIRN